MANAIEDGVYAASLTPVHADLSCNAPLLAEHCKQLIAKGCKGVVLFGTSGEGASFSVEERKKALREVIALGLDPQKIIVGNGSACLQDTIDLALTALDCGCLAFLLAPPCFYKNISEAGTLAFYREAIQCVADPRLKVILYHIPQYSGVPLSLKIIKALGDEFPGIVIGLKESEGNLAFTKAVLKEAPWCKVFVGKEKHIPEAVRNGAAGTICGLANLQPEAVCELYSKGSSSAMDKVFKAFENRSFIVSAKALLALDDSRWRVVLPPLVPLSDEAAQQIKSAMP